MMTFAFLLIIPCLIAADTQCNGGDLSCPEGQTCCTVNGQAACCDAEDVETQLPQRFNLLSILTNSTVQNANCPGTSCNGQCCPGGIDTCCDNKCCKYLNVCCFNKLCCPYMSVCCPDRCCPYMYTCCDEGCCQFRG